MGLEEATGSYKTGYPSCGEHAAPKIIPAALNGPTRATKAKPTSCSVTAISSRLHWKLYLLNPPMPTWKDGTETIRRTASDCCNEYLSKTNRTGLSPALSMIGTVEMPDSCNWPFWRVFRQASV